MSSTELLSLVCISILLGTPLSLWIWAEITMWNRRKESKVLENKKVDNRIDLIDKILK
jgi:hypothetical protein